MVGNRFWRSPTTAALIVAGAVSAGHAEAPATAAPATSAAEIRITHVGNAGFLVEVGGKKVIIDALYRVGVPGHVVLSQEVQNTAESARPPFDGAGLVLATHVHNDHFDANAVGRHLLANPAATFVSTPQTVARMREAFPAFSAVAGRVRGAYPPEGEKLPVDVPGFGLRVLTLHHGRTVPYQNIGFLLDLDGAKLLHVGDTEATHPELGRYALPQEKIDVAFIPFWYLLSAEGVTMVRSAVGARWIVPMHVPEPGAPPVLFGTARDRDAVLKILHGVEGAVVFEHEMETKVVPLR